MITVKFILLSVILGISAFIGITISKKYSTRVRELKEMQRALHIFEEKIKFTYQPIPEVFAEIAEKCIPSIAQIFLKVLSKMLGNTALDGQVSEIRLTEKFIDTKIKEAELEKSKNEKLYKTLGLSVGMAIVIILV